VLDTNVLMHDPMSLFRFEEHDVFLPMITLEELDNHKKGMSEVARNARQVSRELDGLATFADKDGVVDAQAGIELAKTGHREAGGKLFFQTMLLDVKLPDGCRKARPTTRSWAWCARCARYSPGATWCWCPRTSTCASRPARWACPPRTTATTRRSKTPTCSTPACLALPADFWERHGKTMESGSRAATPSIASAARWCGSMLLNQFVYLDGEMPLYARSQGDHRQDRGAEDAARLCARRTRSGASRRATASRTSRSTC
jgi:PhoH-like ATPase